MTKNRTNIGKPTRRVDALSKVLGTAKYVGDYKLPGMLYAHALRSEVPHARIVKLDVSPALAVPGVKAVITSDDFVDNGLYGYPKKDKYMLAYQKVRHVGEAIAVVAAETPQAALAGVQAIECVVEGLTAVTDAAHALDPDAAQVGPDRDDDKHPNLLDTFIVRKGEIEPQFENSDVVIDNHYRVSPQEHAYIETEGALAVPAPGGDIVVYSNSQTSFITRNNLVSVLGMSEDQVRVIQPVVGGAFGGKDDLCHEIAAQVAALALKTEKPVRMTLSRDESMIASYKRGSMEMHIQLAADSDGTLHTCKVESRQDSGSYASVSPFIGWRASIHAMGPYRYNACQIDVTEVYTNNGYAGAFRGFGNTESSAGIEQAIDEMAEAVGMDPIDFRLKNCLQLGDELVYGQMLTDSVGLTECLNEVRQTSGWDQKRKTYANHNAQSKIKKGIGVAAVFHGVSLGAEGEDFAAGTIEINHDYTINLTSGLTDFGQGSRTVFTLIAAEELGVRPERIRMLRPDTDTSLYSGPTVASRSTVLGGNATRTTAQNLAHMLDLAAANLLKCDVEQLLRVEEAYVGPSEEPVTWENVVDHARLMGMILSTHGKWVAPEIAWNEHSGRGMPYFAYHFGAQVVEVTVDTGTGKTDVVGVWAAHDVGKVIFPQGAYGQVYGGIAQGLGYALMERVDYDLGYIQNTNFDEYLIPTALDMPDIEASLIEKHLKVGPYGAKNVAEPAMVPAAPATLNAIYHATGRRVRDLPANLERVLLGHDLRKAGDSTACKLGLLAKPPNN